MVTCNGRHKNMLPVQSSFTIMGQWKQYALFRLFKYRSSGIEKPFIKPIALLFTALNSLLTKARFNLNICHCGWDHEPFCIYYCSVRVWFVIEEIWRQHSIVILDKREIGLMVWIMIYLNFCVPSNFVPYIGSWLHGLLQFHHN